MKNRGFILSFLILLITNFAFAQTTSKKVNYQAVVRNAANELVTNESLSVEITILNANNVPQYRETHASVPTNQNGLLWLWVGEGTPTLGTLDEVVWKDATIQSVFTLPGGNTVTQNTPVSAMPYAYYADEVDTLFLQDYLTTHNYGNEDYVTHEQLNDTLDRYYTKDNVDSKLNDYEKKSDLCGDVKECIKDTLGKYTTTNQIDTLLGAYYDTTQVKNAIHDTADAIRAAIPATQVQSDWTETDDSKKSYIQHKPDLGVYATKDTLNAFATKDTLANFATTNALKDSLTRYVDKDKLTDTLDRYYTKDNVDSKLNDYEKKSDLCGDVKECIKDTLGKYTTTNKIDTLLGVYFDSTKVKTAIHDTADAIRAAIPATQVQSDWTETDDSKKSYIQHKPDLGVYATKDTLNAFATKDTLAYYATTNALKDSLSQYVGKSKLNDTLDRYYTKDNVDSKLNDYEKKSDLCGDVKECIKDTLGRYTTTNKIDTLLGVYFDSTKVKTAIHDTAEAIRAAIPATQVQSDWTETDDSKKSYIQHKPDLGVYATKDTLNAFATKDTLAYYATTNALKDSLSQYVGKSKLNDTLDRYYTKDNVDSKLNDYEKKSDLCGDVKECIKDTLGKYTTTNKIDTLLGVYFDSTRVKTAIHDSLTQNVELTIKSDSLFLKSGGDIDTVKLPAVPEQVKSDWKETNTTSAAYILNKPVIKDSVNIVVKDSLRTANSAINQAVDTIARHNISDSTRMVFDSLHLYYATKEALKDTATAIRHDICDSATTCITKALADANSDINHAIDTIARHNIHDTASALRAAIHDSLNSYKIKDCPDVVTCVNTALQDGTSATNKAIDSIASNVIHDSIKTNIQANINKTIHDSIVNNISAQIQDTVKNAIHDSLSNYKIKDCADVVNCVDNALADGTSATNHAIDTIARHNISDSTRMVFDTLHLYYTTLQTLKDTASNIRSAFPTVNNGTLTIQKNGTSVGSFTANQATPENINIDVPTKLSQMINDGGVYAKRDSINVFTAENNFTSTVTVPSNTTTIPRPTTAEHPCTDNTATAVNICDLLAVFDSLNNRIKKLEDNMALMTSTMKPTTITSSIVNSATTTNAITVQATATNSAFNILSYEFCCSDCGDGVTPVCTTITSNSYTFENLNSYTDYHFTVKAHTFIDTVESSPVQAKTKAEAPTATYVVTALPVPQAGFTVDLSEIDLKGVENGTVKVAYKKSTASNYGNESTENINASSDTYSKTVSNLEGNTSYDVRIKIDNGDAVTTYNATVTTGDAVTFAITRIFPENSSVKRCSGKVSAFFSIAPNIGEVSDYDYQWSTTGSGTSQSQVDSLYLVEYTTTGTKTVSCTATYKLNTDISFQRSVTLSIVKNNNTNVYSGDVPYYDVNIDGHTVTLTDIGGSDMFVDWVSWEDNAFPVVAGNPPAHTYDEYGTYSISAYSSDGCKTTTTNVKIDPSVNVTNDHEPDNIGLCGESEVQVTYTAVPEEGEINDYSYVWSVSTGATIVSQTNNTCIVNYTSAGDYTITCNATHTPSNTPIQKITNTTINSGSKPTLVLCQEDNSLQLLSFGDATYIDWGYDFPNQSSTPHTNEVTPNYPQGSYTVTIRNNAGCSSSKEVYFGVVHSFVPCVLSEIDPSGTHPAQETAATGVDANHNNDGLETVENGAITSITDYDGNVYSVVQIGSQCWLAENMRCTHSPSTGTLIVNPQGLSGTAAKGSCSFKTAHWYNNNPSQYGAYGLYYDWCAAVDTYYVAGGYNETDWGVNTTFHSKAWSCVFTETHRRGICPKGWHIPTDDEWNVMEAEVDGASATYTNTGYRGSHAGKLARDWCRWKSSDVSNAPGNKSANRNSSYFGAMNSGSYTAIGFTDNEDWIQNAYFWSASSCSDNSFAWCRVLTYNKAGVKREDGGREKTNGFPVRCVRD